MIIIRFAENDTEIKRCFPVMFELRPHLKDEEEFLLKVKNLNEIAGYLLAFLEEDRMIKSVAGIRISECLAWGKFLYVDDLVTLSSERNKGYADRLFDWLIIYAKQNSCDQFHLDSGVQRFPAHRFYLKKKMDITSHHFAIKFKELQ